MTRSSSPFRSVSFWILIVILLCFGLYSAYWFFARGQLEEGIQDWVQVQRQNGALVEYSDMTLSGYPFRFVLDVDDPNYSTGADFKWQAEELQLVMQPWNWNHVIARAPGRHAVTQNDVPLELIIGPESAGSLSWTPEALSRASLSLDEFVLLSEDDQKLEAESFEFHVRPPEDDPHALQFAISWQSIDLPEPLHNAAFLGEQLQEGRILVEVTEIGRVLKTDSNLRSWVNAGGNLMLAQGLVNWGTLKLGTKADLSLNPAGRLNGSFDVRIDDAEELVAAISASDLEEDDKPQFVSAVQMLDAASRDGRFLSVTLRDGDVVYLGQTLNQIPPIPLD